MNTSSAPSVLLATDTEIASILGLDRRTVQAMARDGRLELLTGIAPFATIPGQRDSGGDHRPYFRRTDVDDLVQRLTSQTTV